MREIEIKLKVKDLDSIRKKLENKSCIFSEAIIQRDVIYTFGTSEDIWRQSKEGDIALRIRHLANTAEFNVKQQRSNEMDNIEYETEIKDPEALHNILLVLGYVPHVEVKKVRIKGKLQEYEVCLDAVEKLGNFIELEKLTNDNADPEQVREELFLVLESVGLSRSDEETKGYDTQVYQLSHPLS